jgi:hypothetical protein
MKTCYLFTLLLVMAVMVRAQWSNDPSQNLRITQLPTEQALPKVAITPDGYCYVCWFSIENGDYSVRLQRFDVHGNKLWGDEGMVVSDHPTETWLTDYDLDCDPYGNAVIAFQDIRTGYNDVFAYCISPSGNFLWGADGLQLSNNPDFEASPVVAVTAAGSTVVAWQRAPDGGYTYVMAQKISSSGQLQWGDGLIIQDSDQNVTWPRLFPVENDSIMLFWHKDTGVPWSPGRDLYAMKYDPAGNPLWSDPALIYSTPGAPIIASLELEGDGANGIFLTWYAVPSYNHFSVFAHYMDFNGNLLFPANGVEMATGLQNNHMYPGLAHLGNTNELLVFWSEQDANQTMRGIYGQKLTATGQRLWTDNGKEFIPLGDKDPSILKATSTGTYAIVIYHYYDFGNYADCMLKAMCIDKDGEYVWEDEHVLLSSVESGKIHLEISPYLNDQVIAFWEDDRNGVSDIYGQNIHIDGSLGPGTSGLLPDPDTVWFITPEHAINGRVLKLINITGSQVTLNHVDSCGLYWYRLSLPFPLPHVMNASDTVEITLYVNIPVSEQGYKGYIYEDFHAVTDLDTCRAVIAIDEQLISGINTPEHDGDISITCHPNPFSERIHISLLNRSDQNTDVSIFTVEGEKVNTLHSGLLSAGKHEIDWPGTADDGSRLPGGLYFLRIMNDGEALVVKIILLDR